MIDVAIIGAGPAGLSAAINVANRNKTTAVFGRSRESSWLYKAELVNNHLGMPDSKGTEMLDTFYQHAEKMNIQINVGRVLQILPMGKQFAINFDNNFFEAKTIILAIGLSKGITVKGESEFLGKGVSYCATCDGMLYRDKDVVVIGEIDEAEEDVNFLSEICRNTYYLPYYGAVKSVDANVKIINDKVKEIIGDYAVEKVILMNDEIDCSAVFFVKEKISPETIIPGLLVENNSIVTNRLSETSVPGVFAAGDCTGWPFQLSNAIGEGLVAALSAIRYIEHSKNLGTSPQTSLLS